MANSKLTELEPITAIDPADQLLINDDSEASGSKSKYITMQQLDTRFQSFQPTSTPIGEMYQTDNTTETTIAVLNDWVKIGEFVQGEVNLISFSSSSLTSTVAGSYLLTCSLDATGTVSQSRDYEFAAGINGTIQTKVKRTRTLVNTSSGAMSISGVLDVAVGDVIEMYARNITNTDNLLVINANFTIHGI